MKKIVTIILAVLILTPVLLMSGCAEVGPSVTRQYSFTDFTRVQVGSAFQVEITPSNTYSISITAPENWFEHMTVEKASGTLEVGLSFGFWNFWHNIGARPKLVVTMPALEILDMSGATTGTAKGFKSAKDFKLELSGASTADIDIEAYDTSVTVSGASHLNGQLEAHDIRLNISGASTVTLDGTMNNLNLQVSGASHATLDKLNGNDARIELSGASHASVSIDGTMDVFLSGASSLQYTGNPILGTVDITGASSLQRK